MLLYARCIQNMNMCGGAFSTITAAGSAWSAQNRTGIEAVTMDLCQEIAISLSLILIFPFTAGSTELN